jgi:UDPglucose 6-dehydrogenase
MTKLPSVSVIGLGKLGACIAACFADKGFTVVGADVSARTVELMNEGRPPVTEPGLADMLSRCGARLRATQDVAEAVHATEATFIVVPTPSTHEGGFSISYVVDAARSIGRALRDKDGRHLVVLTSTVLPGSTEYGMIPVLESESGKRAGKDFGVCYSPEFIALGQVIKDFLNPEFLLIGEFDSRSGEQLAAVYKAVCDNDPSVARMSLVNAELTKISVNAYVTMRISFANMVAALSEQLPGGDVDTVTKALGLDTRIGSRYLKGALAYGGPCFPRDNQALAYLARQLGQRASLAEAVHAYNDATNRRLADRVLELVPPGGSVAVLGLSYKPDSNVIEEAAGFLLAKSLVESGANVTVHDPMAMDAVRAVLGESIRYAAGVAEAVRGKDVVVIANPDRAYSELDLASIPRSTLVVDAWRMLRTQAARLEMPNYIGLGLGEDSRRLANALAGMWTDPAGARS